MGTKNHQDVTAGAPGAAATFNAPLGQLDDAIADLQANFGDYVVTGGLAGTSASLVVVQPAVRAWILGQRVSALAQNLTMTQTSDNYVDLDTSGVYHITPVANGAAPPPVFANSIRLYNATTSAVAVTSVTDLRPLPANVFAVLNVKASPFNARGDGFTDDTTAIQNAINSLPTGTAASNGGVVYLPPGNYRISARLVVPFNVELRGAGRSATTITALASFPINTELVRLGDLSGNVGVGCRIRGVGVDCNNIAGSTGIYSERINENSGVYECMVRNYVAYGVRINQPASGSQAQNWTIDDLEVFSGTGTGAGAIGVAVTATSIGQPFREISRVTVFATGSTKLTTAIQIEGGQAGIVREIHVENCTNGVLVGSVLACFATVFESITGNTNVTNLLVFSNATTSQNLIAMGIIPQGATNSIVDQIASITLTAEQALYAMGNGSAAQRSVVSTDAAQGSRFKILTVTQSFQPPTPAQAAQAGQIFMANTAPSNANGNNGDICFRTDTTASPHIMKKISGTWTTIV